MSSQNFQAKTMLSKRIIPCLDIKNGRTVKGVHFQDLKDAGDPVALAAQYAEQGADELVFLDITATEDARETMASLVLEVSKAIDIPFTVGGGIRSVSDVEKLLKNGADKISINSSAVRNPVLIDELVQAFGSQCVVVAIDAKQVNSLWKVHLVGGKVPTELDLFEWAQEAADRGAGELLFTSMDHDGSKQGYAIEALAQLSKQLHIPIIASGGAGVPKHFLDAFTLGKADAVLAASVFHFGEIPIPNLKMYLAAQGIAIRK